jgi:hypothetical protein
LANASQYGLKPNEFWQLDWWELTAYLTGQQRATEIKRLEARFLLQALGVKAGEAARALPTPFLDALPEENHVNPEIRSNFIAKFKDKL